MNQPTGHTHTHTYNISISSAPAVVIRAYDDQFSLTSEFDFFLAEQMTHSHMSHLSFYNNNSVERKKQKRCLAFECDYRPTYGQRRACMCVCVRVRIYTTKNRSSHKRQEGDTSDYFLVNFCDIDCDKSLLGISYN